MTVHADAPLHAESCTPLVAAQLIVAPVTGVRPSTAMTCTLTGLPACVPTGVGELRPFISARLSVAAAPYVRTPVITLVPPVTGFVTVRLCTPSEFAGTETIICPAFIARADAAVLPMFTASPGAKPVPSTVTGPPFTPTRCGETESP